MGCDRLVFFAVDPPNVADAIVSQIGLLWHQHGDSRWPAPCAWLEVETSPGGFPGRSGVLVMIREIEALADDVGGLGWIARNNPLMQIFPDERADGAIEQRMQMLRQVQASTEEIPGPANDKPRYIQTYCIYRGRTNATLIARYTDLLNSEGICIPRYRMAALQTSDIEHCRFVLHAVFRLNEARLAGTAFTVIPQLDRSEPVQLEPDAKPAPWVRFHPSRVLRTRPAVRALPTPTNIVEGVLSLESMQEVAETRRIEMNRHMLAFERNIRPKLNPSEDSNSCFAAFVHRANGGAIYQLPDRLVEEFDHTDCGDIRMSDIKLPFTNLFLSFAPPQPLFLAEGAEVDGCYVAKQGDEYLLVLTSRWATADYERSLSVVCHDPSFALHLPRPEIRLDRPLGNGGEISVNEAVERGIAAFLELNAPPTEDMSRPFVRPDGTVAQFVDVRAESRRRRIELFRSQAPVFRACLNIIINAACFISFRPEDIDEEWDVLPPPWVIEALNDRRDNRSARGRREHALRVLAAGEYTKIKICGKKLFVDLPAAGAVGHGISPRAHWRRGHWRRQRHGVGLSLATPRWIRPTVVKRDNGEPAETRIYGFDEPGADDN